MCLLDSRGVELWLPLSHITRQLRNPNPKRYRSQPNPRPIPQQQLPHPLIPLLPIVIHPPLLLDNLLHLIILRHYHRLQPHARDHRARRDAVPDPALPRTDERVAHGQEAEVVGEVRQTGGGREEDAGQDLVGAGDEAVEDGELGVGADWGGDDGGHDPDGRPGCAAEDQAAGGCAEGFGVEDGRAGRGWGGGHRTRIGLRGGFEVDEY